MDGLNCPSSFTAALDAPLAALAAEGNLVQADRG